MKRIPTPLEHINAQMETIMKRQVELTPILHTPICSWCQLAPATTDRYGLACEPCAAAIPSKRASVYLEALRRASEGKR